MKKSSRVICYVIKKKEPHIAKYQVVIMAFLLFVGVLLISLISSFGVMYFLDEYARIFEGEHRRLLIAICGTSICLLFCAFIISIIHPVTKPYNKRKRK